MATKQSLTQKTELRQRQILQQKLGNMLVKNCLEMEDEVRKELDDNPALDAVENDDNAANTIDEEGRQFKESSDDLQRNDEWNEEYLPQRRHAAAVNSRDDRPYEPIIVSEQSLMEHLMTQLGEQNISEQDQVIARHIIGNIDGMGYLRRSARAIADDVTFKEGLVIEAEDVERVLERIKRLDPPGIAAKDLQECLMLQLERKSDAIGRLALRVIRDLFQDYAAHNYAKVRNSLGIDEQRLAEVEKTIKRLDPKPGLPFATSMEEEHGQQITPDFLVDEDLSLSLYNNIPELQISQSYAKMLQAYEKQKPVTRAEKGQLKVTKEKVDKASGYIALLKMRQNTLYRIMSAIMVRQSDYFHHQGDQLRLKPLVQREISEDTGIDVSVISRAITNKYVETPWGVRPLESFFSEGMTQTDEQGQEVEVATVVIKEALKKLVDSEDPDQPLSDDSLCALLNEKGFKIARRTVAKYRNQLKIDPASKRRKRNKR